MAMVSSERCPATLAGCNKCQDKGYERGSTMARDEPAVRGHQRLKERLSLMVSYVVSLKVYLLT